MAADKPDKHVIVRASSGKFAKGHTGNPGGSSKAKMVQLDPEVRRKEGQKFWARLLQIRDGLIKEAYRNEKGEMVYSSPSVKQLVSVCEIGLAYCYGRPAQRMEIPNDGTGPVQINFFLGGEDGHQLGLHVEGRQDAIDSGALPESSDERGSQ